MRRSPGPPRSLKVAILSPNCARALRTSSACRAARWSRRAAATRRWARLRSARSARARLHLAGNRKPAHLASDVYRAAPEKLVHSFAHALPNLWYRMAAMLNGAGALAFAARLIRRTSANSSARRRQHYRGPGEVVFLPYLSGERTPLDDPYARGVAFGFSPPRPAPILRAR